MTINVDLHGKEPGKYIIKFDYSAKDEPEPSIVVWIIIDDGEGNGVTLYFRNPKQVQEFIASLTAILPTQKFAEAKTLESDC
jgi:hypothetical protein